LDGGRGGEKGTVLKRFQKRNYYSTFPHGGKGGGQYNAVEE